MTIGPNVNVNVTYKFLVKQFNVLNLKKLKCFHIPLQNVLALFQVLNF
jgi:hypothetical protein